MTLNKDYIQALDTEITTKSEEDLQNNHNKLITYNEPKDLLEEPIKSNITSNKTSHNTSIDYTSTSSNKGNHTTISSNNHASNNGFRKELKPAGLNNHIYIKLPRKDDKFLSQYKIIENSYLATNFDINDEFILITNTNNELNTYWEAINSPSSKEWIEAMKTKVSELID